MCAVISDMVEEVTNDYVVVCGKVDDTFIVKMLNLSDLLETNSIVLQAPEYGYRLVFIKKNSIEFKNNDDSYYKYTCFLLWSNTYRDILYGQNNVSFQLGFGSLQCSIFLYSANEKHLALAKLNELKNE